MVPGDAVNPAEDGGERDGKHGGGQDDVPDPEGAFQLFVESPRHKSPHEPT